MRHDATTVFFGFTPEKRSVLFLAFIALLPNLFGLVSMPTAFGFRLHVFQFFIFLAALLFGPFGGVVSGSFGSLYTAFLLGSPCIVAGNALLGLLFALFIKKGLSVFRAGLLAFAIQVPYLYVTDVFLAGMLHASVVNIIIALFFGNLLWLFLAKHADKRLQPFFH